MRNYGLALFGALLLFGIASAQKAPPADPPKPDEATFTIKLEDEVGRGKSVVTTKTHKAAGSMKIATPAGKVVNEVSLDETGEEVYTETVLEKGKKKATKLKRVYTKMTKSGKPASYQGQTILFELKGSKYEASVEGDGEVPQKDLKELVKSMNLDLDFDMNKAMVPKKPVKVGESWNPDKAVVLKGLAASFGSEIDASKSTVEAKLLRAYKRGDKQFGVLEFTFKLALTRLATITFDTPATFEVTMKLDTAIDGSSPALTMTGSTQLKGKGELEQGGAKLIVDLTETRSVKGSQSEEK